MLNSNRIARLTAKYENIRSTLGDKSSHSNLDQGNGAGVLTLTRRPNTARRRRIGNAGGGMQTKLFGGSLEEYLEETNQVMVGFNKLLFFNIFDCFKVFKSTYLILYGHNKS